jgi:hypothetical protein
VNISMKCSFVVFMSTSRTSSKPSSFTSANNVFPSARALIVLGFFNPDLPITHRALPIKPSSNTVPSITPPPQMTPPIEIFPASELPDRVQITMHNRLRKQEVRLEDCKPLEMIQYSCYLDGDIVKCEPVVRLFRR